MTSGLILRNDELGDQEYIDDEISLKSALGWVIAQRESLEFPNKDIACKPCNGFIDRPGGPLPVNYLAYFTVSAPVSCLFAGQGCWDQEASGCCHL